MPLRVYILTILRVAIKLVIIIVAIAFGANYITVIILLFLIFLSEIYKNIGAIIISKGVSDTKYIGALISAIDGAALIFALYFAKALQTDMYLFVILSIVINTAEYGLLSAITEGIIAGFSYSIFIIVGLGITDPGYLENTYLIRFIFLVLLGWITGWISSELSDKEKKLNIVLENDVHEQELNDIKDDFITNAAESFKTPVSAIKGYVDILKNGRVGELNDKVKEYLDNILSNVVKIDSLIEELLHIFEIENDTIKLKKAYTSVVEFVNSLKEDANAFAKIYKSNISFIEDIHEEDKISIDEYRLKIAIKNLLFYVFDINGKDIEVSIKSMVNSLDIHINAHVADISEFEIFKSNDVLQKEKITKTSMMKVYTSKLIIESHEGEISVSSQEGIISLYISIPFNIR